MSDMFKISPADTKKVLIAKYEGLLGAYKRKAEELEAAQEELTRSQERERTSAARTAQRAVAEPESFSLDRTRDRLVGALDEVESSLQERAQQVRELDAAIAFKQSQLQELEDIDVAVDSLVKVMALYEERRDEQAEIIARMRADFEDEHRERMSATREEFDTLRAQIDDERARTQREREREEAEYVYQRDRRRARDEDALQEQRDRERRDLEETSRTRLEALTTREAAVATAERELEDLRARAADADDQLERAVERSRQSALDEARREHEAQVRVLRLEGEWELKLARQQIEHLERGLEQRDAKLAEQRAQLDAASLRVQAIAERAVEGASLNQAFRSVNDIALEQARRPDPSTPRGPSGRGE